MSTGRFVLLLLVSSVVLSVLAQEQEAVEDELLAELAAVKRVCVEKFVGLEPHAAQAQEMTIAALFQSKRFRITENCDKADAILKGSVARQEEERTRVEGESASFAKLAGAANSGVAVVGGVAGRSSETLGSQETISQASVTLRITNQDGEVLWAHSEEAKAGKVKGPIAFAIDRVVARLLRDLAKAKDAEGQ
ncbi:MAG: hypothetical protein L0338_27850 [Acidobacteria bacterium]|nr:hypothetical protein [Acidobacteriota bacterium]